MGTLEGEDLERWDAIKRTFKRNLLLGAAGEDNQASQIIAQMSAFSDGLAEIRATLSKGVQQLVDSQAEDGNNETLQAATMREVSHATAELAKFNQRLDEIKQVIESGFSQQPSTKSSKQKIQVINKIPDTFLEVMRNQFRVLQTWMEPILELADANPNASGLISAAKATEAHYSETIEKVIGADPSLVESKTKPKKKASKKTTRRKKKKPTE